MIAFKLVMIKNQFDEYANRNIRNEEQSKTVNYGIKMHQKMHLLDIYREHKVI